MISITIYLDGKTSECGYKYVVQRDCMAWTAYRTDSGFRRFLALYGLKINPQFTQLHDMQAVGKGRAMKLVSIVFEKAASEYRLYYKDEKTGKPYHITANHLLDKEKLWARDANYHQDPYRISWTIA